MSVGTEENNGKRQHIRCPTTNLLERIASPLQVTAGSGRWFKCCGLLCKDEGYVSHIRKVHDQKERRFVQRQLGFSRLVVCYAVSLDQRLLAV